MGYGDTMGDPLWIKAYANRYQIHDPGGRMGKRLRNGAPYENALLKEIKQMNLKGTYLDVGAHIGNHTLYFAIVCGVDVIAVEPFEAVRKQLYANLELNADRFKVLKDRVQVVPVALGAERGFGVWDIRQNPETNRPNRFLNTQFSLPAEMDKIAPIHRFDDLFPEPGKISLVKLDVEGMEADALVGMTDMLKESQPVVYAESHSPQFSHQIGEVLLPLGYHYEQAISPHGTRMELWRV
jgi:FkbM family methyltransferase